MAASEGASAARTPPKPVAVRGWAAGSAAKVASPSLSAHPAAAASLAVALHAQSELRQPLRAL